MVNEKDYNGNAVKRNSRFLTNGVPFPPPPFFNHATAVLRNGIRNFFLSSTVYDCSPQEIWHNTTSMTVRKGS